MIIDTGHNLPSSGTWNPAGTIIAAGGGGGEDDHGSDDGTGGSGGGFQGGAAHKNGVLLTNAATQSSGYSRGKGEKLTYKYTYNTNGLPADGGSGGGGWYSGYAATAADEGGGGGSGYIDTSVLTDAHMAGYQVAESSAKETKTVSVSDVSITAIADTAKTGDGFARITFVSAG